MFFLPGLATLLLGISVSSGVLIGFGIFITLIGLVFLFPTFRRIYSRLKLRKCGVRCDAVVSGFLQNEQLGAVSDFTSPFYSSHKEYHPHYYLCEHEGHRFSFYFPDAWMQPEKMQGLLVSVVYDPSHPSRYYVDRKSVKKAWHAVNP